MNTPNTHNKNTTIINGHHVTLTTANNIKQGDKILDENNNPVTINNLTPIHTPQKMFKITDQHGNTIETSGTHLWYIATQNDIDTHHQRIKETRKQLKPLLKNPRVKNRLKTLADGTYKKGYGIDIATPDLTALLYDTNTPDLTNPNTAHTHTLLQRIAQSVGQTMEETITLQDLANPQQQEHQKTTHYDARGIAQQILAIANTKPHNKTPIRVGRVVTTTQLHQLINQGETIYIPD